MCALGGSSPNPLLTTLRYFGEEYTAHVRDKKCPAGICKDLITYTIHEEKCIGCGACAKACPNNAITGEKKKPHRIDLTSASSAAFAARRAGSRPLPQRKGGRRLHGGAGLPLEGE